MDLSDIRASLAQQGWGMRTGKGNHAVWYPPDGVSRPVRFPLNGHGSKNPRTMANLRATLRNSGWIDPEIANREPLPSAALPMSTSEPEVEPNQQPPENSTTVPGDQPFVVEEAWATSPSTGKVSTTIKEQLLSDESIRYRCAHPYGGGCNVTHERKSGIIGHQKHHGLDARSRPMTKPSDEANPWRATARMRAVQAKDVIRQQIDDAIQAAREAGHVVRRRAIIPIGMGAGQSTSTALLVADPDGHIAYECGDEECAFTASAYAKVFAHRGTAHPRRRHPEATATSPSANDTHAAHEAPTNGSVAEATAIGAALTAAMQQREARASVALDRDPRAQTVAFPNGWGGEDAAAADARKPTTLTQDVATRTGEDPMPVPHPPSGGSFREAVEFVRDHYMEVIDRLRVMAAAEYDQLAATRERDAELERVKAELATLQAERAELIAARDQLAQLRSIFRTMGMTD